MKTQIFVKGYHSERTNVKYLFARKAGDSELSLTEGLCAFWEYHVMGAHNHALQGMAVPVLSLAGLYGWAVKVLRAPDAKVVAPHQAIPLDVIKGSPMHVGPESQKALRKVAELRGIYGPEFSPEERVILKDSPLELGGIRLSMEGDAQIFRISERDGHPPRMSFALACEFAACILRSQIVERFAPRYYVPHLITRDSTAWENGGLRAGEPLVIPVLQEPAGQFAKAWLYASAEDIAESDTGDGELEEGDETESSLDSMNPDNPEAIALWLLNRAKSLLNQSEVQSLQLVVQAVSATTRVLEEAAERLGISPITDSEITDSLRALALAKATLRRLQEQRKELEDARRQNDLAKGEVEAQRTNAKAELDKLFQQLSATLAERERELARQTEEISAGRKQLETEREQLLNEQIAVEEKEKDLAAREEGLKANKARLLDEMMSKLSSPPAGTPAPGPSQVPKDHYYFPPSLVKEIETLASRGGRTDVKTEELARILKAVVRQLHKGS